MGKLTLKDADISLDGNDISDHIPSVTIDIGKDEVENTAFGSTTHTFQADGLRTLTITLEAQADYADDDLDEILWGIYDGDAGVVCIVKPTSGAVSAANPSYTATVSLQSFTPVSGAVGDLASGGTINLIPTTGALVRATA